MTTTPITNPTLFDYGKSAFSAPGVRPRWIYVPASVYVPELGSRPDLIKGLTVFYGGTASGERTSTMLAVLHPTEAEHASRIGWDFTTLNLEGADAPQVISQARGQRCWWITIDDNALLKALIDLAKARDGAFEEKSLALSHARASHASDVEAIGNALREEADERGWCSEYDEFVDSLNHRLTYDLPLREREFEVEVEVTYRMTVSVTATSEDDALRDAEREEAINHDDATAWTISNVGALEATESG